MSKSDKQEIGLVGGQAAFQSGTTFDKATQALYTALRTEQLRDDFLKAIALSKFNFKETFVTFAETKPPGMKTWYSGDMEEFENRVGSSISAVNSVITVHGNVKINPIEMVKQDVEVFIDSTPSLRDNKEQLMKAVPEIYESLGHCRRISYTVASYDSRFGVNKEVHVSHEPENPAVEKKERNWVGALPYSLIGNGIPAIITFYVTNSIEVTFGAWVGGSFVVTALYVGSRVNKAVDTAKTYIRGRLGLGKEVQQHKDAELPKEYSHLKPEPGPNLTGREVSYEIEGDDIDLNVWAASNSNGVSIDIKDKKVKTRSGVLNRIADLFRGRISDNTPSGIVALEKFEMVTTDNLLVRIVGVVGAHHDLKFTEDDEGYVSNGEKLEIGDRRMQKVEIRPLTQAEETVRNPTRLRKALNILPRLPHLRG